MSIAEQIITGISDTLMNRLGFTADQLKTSISGVIQDAAAIKNGVLGARQGFGAGMAHFNIRLDRIEANQHAIMSHLNIPLASTPPDQPRIFNGTNGHDHPKD